MAKYAGKPPESLSFKNILYAKEEWRATLTINRPRVHNCLNLETLLEMSTAFRDAAWDDHVAVLIITGAGNKAFCTGADMKEWKEEFLDRPPTSINGWGFSSRPSTGSAIWASRRSHGSTGWR